MFNSSASDEFSIEDTKMSERRRWSMRDITTIAVLLLNFGGLVWGAATMRAALDTVEKTVVDLKSDLKAQRVDWEPRLRLVEAEIAVVKAQIYLIERP